MIVFARVSSAWIDLLDGAGTLGVSDSIAERSLIAIDCHNWGLSKLELEREEEQRFNYRMFYKELSMFFSFV